MEQANMNKVPYHVDSAYANHTFYHIDVARSTADSIVVRDANNRFYEYHPETDSLRVDTGTITKAQADEVRAFCYEYAVWDDDAADELTFKDKILIVVIITATILGCLIGVANKSGLLPQLLS